MIWFERGEYTGDDASIGRDRLVPGVSRRASSNAVTKTRAESDHCSGRADLPMGFLAWPEERILRTLRKVAPPFIFGK
jgi:hypothetical protein